MADTIFPNVPSITIEHESAEMQQWAYEASAAIEAASAGGTAYLARMKDAGELLSKAKKKCKHGQWIPWLNRHGISRMKAFRAIKAFSKCNTVVHLDEAMPDIAEEGIEEETTAPPLPDQSLIYCGTNCRSGIGPSKCKACKKLRAEAAAKEKASAPKPKPLTPEQIKATKLAEILARGAAQVKLATSAINLSKKIRQIERWDIYRKTSGDRQETFAESLYKAWKQLAVNAPSEACKLCKGDVMPAPELDPCDDCGGKGVLTAAEVQAIKERLNF